MRIHELIEPPSGGYSFIEPLSWHHPIVLRLLSITGILVLALAGCSSNDMAGQRASKPQDSEKASEQPTPAPPQMSQDEMIQSAVSAVEAALPDSPLWKGMTFAGSVVDDSTVCVDRTWRPGGGLDGKGGSAGYVLVTFPSKTLGEPTDGTCSEVVSAPNKETVSPVDVPENLKGNPGLVTRTDLGKDWPLTVDYGVVACQPKTVDERVLQIATFTGPDGVVYALNGTAKSHTNAADIDPIWAPDPTTAGLKIGIGPLIERARRLC